MRLPSIPLLLLCLLPACSAPDLEAFARKHATPEERAFAQSYLQLLATAQVDSAAAMLAPNLQSDAAVHALQRVGALLQDARLDSLHLIGVSVNENLGTGTHELNLTYEAVSARHASPNLRP